VFVFDLTEPYPISDQLKLFENVKEIRKPVIIYLSKKDLLGENPWTNFFLRPLQPLEKHLSEL
jgi:GTP1/Obg family GTP-binding protein